MCTLMNECAIEMPQIGYNCETLRNFQNEIKIPFIVYADTEALLKQPEIKVLNTDCSTNVQQQSNIKISGSRGINS